MDSNYHKDNVFLALLEMELALQPVFHQDSTPLLICVMLVLTQQLLVTQLV